MRMRAKCRKSGDAAGLMISLPIYEERVYGSPVVIAKVTRAECLKNLHVKYLLHIEPDAYIGLNDDGLE